ncbi:S-layer homology domain-containing protein [Paenibacillus sp. UNC499MF]|uniref:S-layer homology domain-containing protein n=1 Tax=Paenibacillus sp. UNC499MF TaxID=1502751 RepID=UPI00089FB0F7|nr:S-layer homology domain-containing protein [Paenibacillus sp. UNC499MF]SEG73507.1 S-layer homology domain-containing protein [Paenibacillus sp. UNC499MF]
MKLARLRRFMNLFSLSVLVLGVLLPNFVQAASTEKLTDLGRSYAQKEITSLISDGILSGYPDGTFKPENPITRAELAKILVLALGLKEEPAKSASFHDVDASSWYSGYVGSLVASGITQGTTESTFSPDAKVTREELVVFFVRAFGLAESVSAKSPASKLADLDTAAEWAIPSVSLAYEIGFVNGIDNGSGGLIFKPKSNSDRQAVARLAYEFKTNKQAYVNKAKEILASKPEVTQPELQIQSLTSQSSTTIEVTFSSALTELNKEDFKFDHDLLVTAADFKAGSKTVVVLTTMTQNSGTKYTLTYKGKPSGKSVDGTSPVFGGGGGGGFGGGGAPGGIAPTVEQLLASGKPQGAITVQASGTYGPANGKTSVQTLILDPGPAGEVSLNNIDAEQLEVRSGSANSIKLRNAVIKTLKVNAINNNGLPVRVEAGDGTQVTQTEVTTQAVLEGSSVQGGFGKIKLDGSGKKVSFKGKIDSEITVHSPGVTIYVESPTAGNNQPTILTKLTVAAADTTVNMAPGAILSEINSGQSVTLTGSSESIAKIKLSGGGSFKLDPAVANEVKEKAIANANKALKEYIDASGNFSEFLAKVLETDKAIQIAKQYGAEEQDFASIQSFYFNRDTVYELNEALTALTIGYVPGDSSNHVTERPTLPAKSVNDTHISWSSSDPDALSMWSPYLNRPASGAGDKEITLTATLFNKAFSATKSFKMTIKQFNASVKSVAGLKPDLLVVEFDAAVATQEASWYQFTNGLQVLKITQYPQYPNLVLLGVNSQKAGSNYNLTYKNAPTGVTFTGSAASECSAEWCTIPGSGQKVPVPGVNVPGKVEGYVLERLTYPSIDTIVSLEGTGLTAKTDSRGYYKFTNVAPNVSYTITATKPGFSTGSTAEFSIAPAQTYMAPTVFIFTVPDPVSIMQLMPINYSDKVYLSWSMSSHPGSEVTFNVYQNGTLRVSDYTGSSLMIDALKAGETYTFGVEACNEVGCSKTRAEQTIQMPLNLSVHSFQPYNSVTSDVYVALKTTSRNEYSLSQPYPNFDSILVELKEGFDDGTPGTPAMQSDLDLSNAKITGIGVESFNSSVQIYQGRLFLKIDINTSVKSKFDKYVISGVKYKQKAAEVYPFSIIFK